MRCLLQVVCWVCTDRGTTLSPNTCAPRCCCHHHHPTPLQLATPLHPSTTNQPSQLAHHLPEHHGHRGAKHRHPTEQLQAPQQGTTKQPVARHSVGGEGWGCCVGVCVWVGVGWGWGGGRKFWGIEGVSE